MKKRIAAFVFLAALCALPTFAKSKKKTKEPPEPKFTEEIAIKDTGNKPMKGMSAMDIVMDMKTGWNLGNTFDATGGRGVASELSWGQPKTTREMIDELARAGFKTIRIPVSWHNHLYNNGNVYTIDPRWMERVKEVVDWAIDNDMYVILNMHHDNYEKNAPMPYGGGYYPTAENEKESLYFLKNVWGQIALAFNNGYDEHLIFETLNEPRLVGTPVEWYYNGGDQLSKDAAGIINKFNQTIVDVIRASGGNNAKRLISCPGYCCSPASVAHPDFVLPEDPAKMIAVAVHSYSPYNFAMENPGISKYSKSMLNGINSTAIQLQNKYVKQGIPVYIGEYGATNKDNLEDRVEWFKGFVRLHHAKGIPCILWDNNAVKKDANGYSEKYGFFNRKECSWYFPEIIDAIMESCAD